jgi:protein-S-isoprenylcysteine O-methyltransferase Ste14
MARPGVSHEAHAGALRRYRAPGYRGRGPGDSGVASTDHHIWRPSPVESSIALALVVAGAAFALWARFTIGTNWSGVVTLKQDHELMQSGPYHVVRHPIYTGLLTMGLGSSLQYDEVYGFLFLVLAAVMLAFKMRLEERLMMENFPDQYPQYRQHVKAIVPFVL